MKVGEVFKLSKMYNGLDSYEENVYLLLVGGEEKELIDYSHSLRLIRRHKLRNIYRCSRVGYNVVSVLFNDSAEEFEYHFPSSFQVSHFLDSLFSSSSSSCLSSSLANESVLKVGLESKVGELESFVATWKFSLSPSSSLSIQDLKSWLPQGKDVYMIGLQHCNYTVPPHPLIFDPDFPSHKHFFYLVETVLGSNYSPLAFDQIKDQLSSSIFVHKKHLPYFSLVEVKKIVKRPTTNFHSQEVAKDLFKSVKSKIKSVIDTEASVIGTALCWSVYTQKMAFLNLLDNSLDSNKFVFNFKSQTLKDEDLSLFSHLFCVGSFPLQQYQLSKWTLLTSPNQDSHILLRLRHPLPLKPSSHTLQLPPSTSSHLLQPTEEGGKKSGGGLPFFTSLLHPTFTHFITSLITRPSLATLPKGEHLLFTLSNLSLKLSCGKKSGACLSFEGFTLVASHSTLPLKNTSDCFEWEKDVCLTSFVKDSLFLQSNSIQITLCDSKGYIVGKGTLLLSLQAKHESERKPVPFALNLYDRSQQVGILRGIFSSNLLHNNNNNTNSSNDNNNSVNSFSQLNLSFDPSSSSPPVLHSSNNTTHYSLLDFEGANNSPSINYNPPPLPQRPSTTSQPPSTVAPRLPQRPSVVVDSSNSSNSLPALPQRTNSSNLPPLPHRPISSSHLQPNLPPPLPQRPSDNKNALLFQLLSSPSPKQEHSSLPTISVQPPQSQPQQQLTNTNTLPNFDFGRFFDAPTSSNSSTPLNTNNHHTLSSNLEGLNLSESVSNNSLPPFGSNNGINLPVGNTLSNNGGNLFNAPLSNNGGNLFSAPLSNNGGNLLNAPLSNNPPLSENDPLSNNSSSLLNTTPFINNPAPQLINNPTPFINNPAPQLINNPTPFINNPNLTLFPPTPYPNIV